MPNDNTPGRNLRRHRAPGFAEAPAAPPRSNDASPTDKLRAMLSSGSYAGSDCLDDYGEDFRRFGGLSGVETADMRHQRERQNQMAAPEPAGDAACGSNVSEKHLKTPRAEAGTLHDRTLGSLTLTAERCAHAYARRQGCRRCIDSCPFNAIRPGEAIPNIDPRACDQCGACVSACPSGALAWKAMTGRQVLTRLKEVLTPWMNSDRSPLVVFHDRPDDDAAGVDGDMQETVWFRVSPIAVIGMETILSVLAWGAAGVYVMADTADRIEHAPLGRAMRWSAAVIQALGWPSEAIGWLAATSNKRIALQSAPADFAVPVATYSLDHPKPVLLRLAVEHLYRHGGDTGPAVLQLDEDVPFGTVRVDGSRCTLCMACAGACRTRALFPRNGRMPGLHFIEQRCVQCGLCANMCPEQAISLVPRLNLDHAAAIEPVVLHRAEPARCPGCGRAFATQQMIDAVRSKLQGHWMYLSTDAQKRLGMCEQCRLQDLYSKQQQSGT